MLFLTNFQKPTKDFFEKIGYSPLGWLLSSHRSTNAQLERAESERNFGKLLMADNGTIVFIRETESLFESDAVKLKEMVRDLRKSLSKGRRVPYTTEISSRMRRLANEMAAAVNADVDQTFDSISPEIQEDIQFSMDPTHVIAKEDWSVAVALSLGLEREILGWKSGRYVTRNRQSLRGWKQVCERQDASGKKVFATLAATDYVSAKAVAKEAANWGVENIALGFAGLNSTPGYSDVTYYPRRHRLKQVGPRRYVRLAEIVLGFRDGYRESKTTLQNFHALGLGSRVMWLILSSGLDWWTEISIDATSAIKDVSGRAPVVYVPEKPAARLAVSKLADSFVETGKLPFESDILRRGLKEFPCDLGRARELKAKNQIERITHNDLRSGKPYADLLPLFANGSGTSKSTQYLVHHNYWASDLFASKIPQQNRRKNSLAILREVAETSSISITVRNGCKVALEILT